MTSSSATRGAMLALLATIGIWAYSWIVMKQALRYAGPFDFTALRYLGGAAVLFAALLLTRQPLRPPPLLATVGIGLTQTAAFQGLAQWALVSGGAGKVALYAYAMPFWTVLLAWPLLAERPLPRHWAALALAAAGLLLVIAPWRGQMHPFSTMLALLGSVGWALGTVLSKRLFLRREVAPLNLAAWQMLVGAVALALVAWWVPQPAIRWTAAFVGLWAYSAVVASALAWGLWLIVVRQLPAAVASMGSLGVPVVSVLLAWPLLHERPDWDEAAGFALIAAGMAATAGLLRRRG